MNKVVCPETPLLSKKSPAVSAQAVWSDCSLEYLSAGKKAICLLSPSCLFLTGQCPCGVLSFLDFQVVSH